MEIKDFCPDWCGSVGCMLSHKAKYHQFDSQAGHTTGFWAWSQWVRVQEATNQCFSLTWTLLSFLSPSLPLSLKLK